MLAKRLIVCLHVQGGRVVKGTNVQSLADKGAPHELAAGYEAGGADGIPVRTAHAPAERSPE